VRLQRSKPVHHFFEPLAPQPLTKALVASKVNLIASHMLKQWKEHEEACANTNLVFDKLLDHLEPFCDHFKMAFDERNMSPSRVFYEVDADRSVGILNILWHAISFTARGNSKPLALYRPGREPVFTGRIVALHGDFQDLAANDLQAQTYPELLQFEIASLFVPADPMAPAVMRIKHLGDEELYYNQTDAPRLFLLKTLEMICGGGFFHERDF
jgi:hypothetical protein